MPSPSALLASAQAHLRAGRFAAAAELYRQMLAANPAEAEALQHLGLISLHGGDAPSAESYFARAIAARPSVAVLHVQRGLALRALRRPADALGAFTAATILDPAFAEAHHQAGNALKALGRFPEALVSLGTAARLAPNDAAIWLNLGVAALESGARDEALAAFQHAAALEPSRPETHNILGHTLAAAGRGTEARAAFAEALQLRPNYAAAHNNLGRLDKAEGLLAAAIVHYRAALAVEPSPATHSNLLFALNFLPDVTPEAVFAEHRRWHELYAAPLTAAAPPLPPVLPREDRRLRVGYVSADFNHHAVAYFIEPVLAAHDRTRVEVFCYANVRTPDRVTARLRGLAEHWRDLALLDDEAAAALIRADQLDLLIDLAGHSAHHRLLVFARRPAPVQATWIGYPNTTGLDAIDYRLTDAISDPPRETDPLHSEKLLRLPSAFSCYRPDDDAPPVNALPATDPDAVTFGCFNNFAKLTPAVLALWGRLLHELPAARLLLKSRGLGDAAITARVQAGFAAAGVAPDRVLLNGDELSVAAHLSLYHGVDLALDPFPYNGTTTTCEALWMGVPVLTLAGRTHASRVGASLLTHVGLPDWIATSPDDYLSRALAAARDLPRLAALRRTLRERMRTSPVCAAESFTRGLEQAFDAMASRRA